MEGMMDEFPQPERLKEVRQEYIKMAMYCLTQKGNDVPTSFFTKFTTFYITVNGSYF
jgi:hypothetical protein